MIISLKERSDFYLVRFIAPYLGWLARQRMNLGLAWERDLAANPVQVTIPADRVAGLSEGFADRRAELIPLMLGGLGCSGEFDALSYAGATITRFTEQSKPVYRAGTEQPIGGSALYA